MHVYKIIIFFTLFINLFKQMPKKAQPKFYNLTHIISLPHFQLSCQGSYSLLLIISAANDFLKILCTSHSPLSSLGSGYYTGYSLRYCVTNVTPPYFSARYEFEGCQCFRRVGRMSFSGSCFSHLITHLFSLSARFPTHIF